MRASPAGKSTNTRAASIVVGVASLGVILGLLAGLAMQAAERFQREEAIAGPRAAVVGRPVPDQRRWSYATQPGGPVESVRPGPMHLQLFCEQCPPPAPTDL